MQRYGLGLLVFLAAATVCADDTAALGEAKATLEAIRSAWQERLSKVSSGRFEFDVAYFEKARVMPGDATRQASGADGGASQLDTLHWTASARLSIDGDRMFFSMRGDRQLGGGRLLHLDDRFAYDGTLSTSLSPPNPDEQTPYPSGHIYDKKFCGAVRLSASYPIRWAFAPFLPQVAEFDLAQLEVRDMEGVVGDQRCPVLIQRGARPYDPIFEYFVDPARGFSIVRYSITQEGHVTMQLDCQYGLAPVGMWIPSEWTVVRMGADAEPVSTERATITKRELNPTFMRDEFTITFPVGTVVSDERPQPGIGRTGTFDYIVMPDGSKRQITWNERNAKYAELMASPSGTATGFGDAAARAQPTSKRLIWLNMAALALLTALLLIRRWLRRRHGHI